MPKKRGNPNWGKPDPQTTSVIPTSFEEAGRRLRLSPAEYGSSAALKEWARKNKGQKYVPDDLLKFWDFEVKGEL